MAAHDASTGIGSPATMHTGPLGSVVHVLRADAGTIADLAPIDWNRWFGRVCLDSVRGLVVLMATSHLHEDLSEPLDDVVDVAAARASKRLGSTRLRAPHEPPGTGMEPDCAIYLDERAEAYRAALVEGEAAAEAFFERTPLDLVVEVEITHADAGRIERYADIGVRELWRPGADQPRLRADRAHGGRRGFCDGRRRTDRGRRYGSAAVRCSRSNSADAPPRSPHRRDARASGRQGRTKGRAGWLSGPSTGAAPARRSPGAPDPSRRRRDRRSAVRRR